MTNKNSGRRLIFIGGSPRSGTTLVQNMLDCHPNILGGPEFLQLERIIKLRQQFHYSISIGYIDAICTKDDVDHNISELIEKFLLPLADKNNCEFYSEKTPKNILIFSELMEVFPEAHFIMVTRDPRAIVSSMQQVRKRAIDKGLKQPFFTKTLSSSIAYVKKCYETGFNASQSGKCKLLTVSYEQLLSDLENETKRITKFLEIEWDKQMLYPANKKHLGEKAITKNSGEIWYDTNSYYRNPDKQNIEKWQSKLTARQKIITTLAFEDVPEFKNFGYDLSLKSLKIDNEIFAKVYCYYIRSRNAAYQFLALIARKIPGVSFAKRKILSAIRII